MIDGSGFLSVQLPSTNDPDLNVTGWGYLVTEHIPNGRPPYTIEVPHNSGAIDLATVVPATPTPIVPVTTYLRL